MKPRPKPADLDRFIYEADMLRDAVAQLFLFPNVIENAASSTCYTSALLPLTRHAEARLLPRDLQSVEDLDRFDCTVHCGNLELAFSTLLKSQHWFLSETSVD
jgi:hypothetical protein